MILFSGTIKDAEQNEVIPAGALSPHTGNVIIYRHDIDNDVAVINNSIVGQNCGAGYEYWWSIADDGQTMYGMNGEATEVLSEFID